MSQHRSFALRLAGTAIALLLGSMAFAEPEDQCDEVCNQWYSACSEPCHDHFAEATCGERWSCCGEPDMQYDDAIVYTYCENDGREVLTMWRHTYNANTPCGNTDDYWGCTAPFTVWTWSDYTECCNETGHCPGVYC
jgi:hypothetical protein